MAERWFVCYCEPKRSIDLAEALRARGFEAECPSFEFRRRVPRKRRTELLRRPLIGGILFLGVDSWPVGDGFLAGVNLSRLRRMMTPSGPAVVENHELEGLRQSAAERTDSRSELRKGDFVEICFGPFKGRRAAVEWVGPQSVTVSIEDFSGRADIPAFLLRKVTP